MDTMKMQKLAVVLTILGLPAVASADDWEELRGDASGSRASAEISGTDFTPLWSYSLKNQGKIVAAPVSVDGLVLTAGVSGDIAAIGLHDGAQRWARVLDGGVGSTPATARGRAVVSTFAGELYSLSLKDGTIGWQRPFGGTMNYSSPVLVEDAPGSCGSVVVPAGFPSQDVYRIDLKTGETQWSTSPGDIAALMYTSAAVTKDQAIVGMNGGRYQSLDLRTGKTRWKFDPGGAVDLSSALIDGNAVYMFPGNAASELFAADPATGQPLAGFPVAIPDPAPIANDGMLGRGPAMSSPMMAGGLVVLQLRRQHILNNPVRGLPFRVAMREYVVAVDPRQGKVVWQRELANVTASDINGVPELNTCPTPAAFAYSGGTAIAVASSITSRVAIIDVASGGERWSAVLPAPSLASPTFSNGKLLFATTAGAVHAFASRTNAAPTVPTALTSSGDPSDGTFALGWNAGRDPEGETLSYRVRVVEEGTDTTIDNETAPGQTTLPVVLKAHTTYEVTVRSRDPKGALSAWSASHIIAVGDVSTATTTPSEMGPPPGGPMGPAPGGPMGPPPAGELPPPPPGDATPATETPPAEDEVPASAAPASEIPATPSSTSDVPAAAAPTDDDAMAGGCSVGGSSRSPSSALSGLFVLALVLLTRRARRA
jgi:outer membrane protein assembly factor BamB